MKKIKLLCLSFLGLLIGFINFSSAGLITQDLVLTNENVIKGVSYTPINDTWVYIKPKTGIIKAGSFECSQVRLNTSTYLQASCGGYTMNELLTNFKFSSGSYYFECINGQNCDGFSLNIGGFTFDYTFIDTGSSCDYSGYVLESNVTENYCTNKFSNLIDESDITSSYCETQFNLIDPSDCPSSGSTGDIMWSSFWVNDRQVLGGENIYLYIPDWLDWSYTYIDQNLQVEVVNEGDEDYINDILTVQQYHPSNEDFTLSFVGGLTLILPYIIVVLFIVFVWKLIKKIFK